MSAYFAALAWALWGVVTFGGGAAGTWLLLGACLAEDEKRRNTTVGALVILAPVWLLVVPLAAVLP